MREYIVTKTQTWRFEVEDFRSPEAEAYVVMELDEPDYEFIDYERVDCAPSSR